MVVIAVVPVAAVVSALAVVLLVAVVFLAVVADGVAAVVVDVRVAFGPLPLLALVVHSHRFP